MNKSELQVIHETNHYIVVIKPSGILSQADSTGDIDMLSLVREYLRIKYNKPGEAFVGLVHRLDRMTSGIMVFAKTSKGASRLNEQIKEHLFYKKYYALVSGHIDVDGTFVDELMFDEVKRKAYISKGGKLARLNYKVVEHIKDNTLVDVELITGRHHQIRIQFGSRGYPLVGDTLYGSKIMCPIKLHAYELSFLDPITKERITFNNNPKWIERK